MARMPDIAAEARAAVGVAEHVVREWFHHDQGAASAALSTQQYQPEAHPMSAAFTEIQHLLAVADEDTIHALNVVLAHPEGIAVVSDLAAVAGIALPPGTITSAVGGLKAVLALIMPQQAPAPVDGAGAQALQQ
jgi:hypothetical protein